MARAWVAILWFGIFLIGGSCTSRPKENGAPPSVESGQPSHTIGKNGVEEVEGWIVFKRKVRDIIVSTTGMVLVSNSAPLFGKSPEDGAPFIIGLDLFDEKVIWELAYDPVAPVTENSQDMFIIEESEIIAVGLTSGNVKWITPFDAGDFAQASSNEEMVLVGNSTGLFAFDAESGEFLWKSILPLPFDMSVLTPVFFQSWKEHSALSILNDIVFARRRDEIVDRCQTTLIAFDANNGSDLWNFPFNQVKTEGCQPGTFFLGLHNGFVLVGALGESVGQCSLYALEEKGGDIIWQYDIQKGCYLRTGIAIWNNLFVVLKSDEMIALDINNGQFIWEKEYPSGGNYQLIPNSLLLVSQTKSATRIQYMLWDLQSQTGYEFEVPVLSICDSFPEFIGVVDNHAVIERGNCLRVVDLGQWEKTAD